MENFTRKIAMIQKKFTSLVSPQEKYRLLIDLGKECPTLPPHRQNPSLLVAGCQSQLYLDAHLVAGKIFFECASDALISKGLAGLLFFVYNNEAPDTVLDSPPSFLKELGIIASLSMNRSNGLAHIYLSMRQRALNQKELLSVSNLD